MSNVSQLACREATLDDIDQLAEWNHQLIRDEGHRNPMTLDELAERMRDWLAEDYRAVILELAAVPVAYGLFREDRNEIYLRQFVVARSHRRQGVGQRFFSLLKKMWPDEKRLTVDVLTSNTAAVEFWRRVGYSDYSLTLEMSRIGGPLPPPANSKLQDPAAHARTEKYTPGHSQNATDFMSLRTLQTHGDFFLPHLKPGLSVLDCGCGPGSITLDIAEQIQHGHVVGIDFVGSQFELARVAAQQRGVVNSSFQTGDIYSLPFENESFDRVFSHAVMEHLTNPIRALQELFRILKPGGVIGVCSPDWGGFILSPPSEALSAAVAAYTKLQAQNGGDVNVGRWLGSHLSSAGFKNCQMSARYENYPNQQIIAEYLALQLERSEDDTSAEAFRCWSQESGGLFAQCWVSCVAQKPGLNS